MTQSIPARGPKAAALIERDAQVISSSYPRGYPFVMDHGAGCEVWDVDGYRYLDFAAGIAVNSTGHSHPKVVRAIQEQAEKFIHISSDYYHETWIRLGEKLAEIAPFDEPAACFMTNSGTEAVETAIKLARYATGRSQLIAFFGGFHGRTMGSVTLTASKSRYHQGFFPLMNGVTHIPYPDPYHPLLVGLPEESYGETVIRYLEEEVFARNIPPEEVAAIVIEPIQGEGGYIVPAEGFFPALREVCDRHGILLIADEVQCGMGRTGKWWAIEHFGVEPDMVCSAKGIASGMPLGALIARKSLMTWPRGAHGNTYGGNPIACAAALATIELIEDEMMANVRENGPRLLEGLKKLAQANPAIGEVRGIGLMIGLELVEDRDPNRPAAELRDRIVDQAFLNGLLLLGCGKSVIRFAPPLCVSRAEVEEGLDLFERALKAAL